jgi:histidinol dehydrogenase
VRDICEAVRGQGDEALLRFERQFDCATFEMAQLRVTCERIEAAWQSLPGDVRSALQRAADNIEFFHRKQPVGDWTAVSPDGVFLGQRYTPMNASGCMRRVDSRLILRQC